MGIKSVIFSFLFLFAIGFFFYNLRRILSYLRIGQSENRFDNISERIKNVLKIAFGQSKLLREPAAGIIHFLIFWGFMLFLLVVVESIIQGFYYDFNFSFLGRIYLLITFVQDTFGFFVMIAVLAALYRRFIIKVPRLNVGKKGNLDAAVILLMIFGIVFSMFGQNVINIINNDFRYGLFEFKPVSMFISKLFFSDSNYVHVAYYEFFWWMHIGLILLFLNFLPYSKHFHVVTSIPNVFFSKLGNEKFIAKAIDLEDENREQFGAADIEHLTWKQLLDGFSCTECGRCTAACPAANTGKKLSPREIIINIRHRTEEKAPLILKGDDENQLLEKTLVHNYITDEELWACTTCGACVYECPVSIEHLDAIIDMRRNLVLMESNFPPELNTVFKNIETNFTPWAFNWQDRANWAEGMDIKTMAEDPECEYLFWVGCAGSFDARYQKVTKAIAKLLQIANINFRILGIEEKCNGDTARRLGNEYLAQMLIQENVETLNNYGVKKIVTACPHCFNTIKNEYPKFGGKYEVEHHSELLIKLIAEGKIKINNESREKIKVTYHDSCYLGRYNNIYNPPREILNKFGSLELIEMERSKDKGFCCGAGGGRMFLEENEGERININRSREAVETGAQKVVSACPFCMTMLNDGMKSLDKSNEIEVKDIAEIILENVIIN
ncbi:heterodisulfide reductase-related iron-sulfur binding cluster [Melioribacter sp. OK-6-Me]|uniref:(Fe-S)-binding protein n=1 Tax=unclassified Melioribacter TaxID=2627329 RepID=UPI003EDA4330